MPPRVSSEDKFNADGSYESAFRSSSSSFEYKGTYRLDGSQLALTVTEGTIDGKAVTEPSTSKVSLRWITPNQIELSDPRGGVTLTRRKDGKGSNQD